MPITYQIITCTDNDYSSKREVKWNHCGLSKNPMPVPVSTQTAGCEDISSHKNHNPQLIPFEASGLEASGLKSRDFKLIAIIVDGRIESIPFIFNKLLVLVYNYFYDCSYRHVLLYIQLHVPISPLHFHNLKFLKMEERGIRPWRKVARNFSKKPANMVEKLWLVKEMVLQGETAKDLSKLDGIGR